MYNESNYGIPITNAQVVGENEKGKYALDAMENNPSIKGSLRQGLNNVTAKVDSYIVNAWNNFHDINKEGYIHLARIKTLKCYSDYPIEFTLMGRWFTRPVKLTVLFKGANTYDPDIDIGHCIVHNAVFLTDKHYKFYIVKETASTWSVYINHYAYGGVAITRTEVFKNNYFDITYPNTLVDLLPDGALEFTAA